MITQLRGNLPLSKARAKRDISGRMHVNHLHFLSHSFLSRVSAPAVMDSSSALTLPLSLGFYLLLSDRLRQLRGSSGT